MKEDTDLQADSAGTWLRSPFRPGSHRPLSGYFWVSFCPGFSVRTGAADGSVPCGQGGP